MAGREINLLPEETLLEKEREKHRERSIFSLTILASFLAALFILGAFVYSLHLRNQAETTRKKIEIEKQKIERMKNKEFLLFWTKTKVLAIQKILSGRPLHKKQLESLDLVTRLAVDNGLGLTDYASGGKNLNFVAVASSSASIESFIQNFLEENKGFLEENKRQVRFRSIGIKSFESRKDGGYKLSFTANLSD